jgi:type I restriction enzyme S subunit
LQLPIPHPDKQREIVKEYNVIQNRIALNQQLIQKLEETAQAIYRQWFVEFEFPDENGKPYKSNGGEMVWNEELQKDIPLGWEIASIGKYSKVKSGFAFKSEWWQTSGIPVVKIGSINNNTIDKDSLDFVNADRVEKAKNYRVQEGDIVIAMTGATIGKIGLVPKLNDTILVNQRVGMFDLGNKPTEKTAFLYFNLLTDFVQNEIKNVGGDSAQANISNGQIQEIEMLYPTSNLILNFNRIGQPIIETILRKIAENQKLTELKDLLLSKLATIEN